MSIFEFCLEIVARESNKLNVAVNTAFANQITAATISDINFDKPHHRCSYLYRCGAINLSFARDCFKAFLLNEKSKFFLSKCSDLTICSLSQGPALDYISLLLAYQECNISSSLFNSIKLITKYGAWRNTVNIIIELLKEGYLKCLPPSASPGDIEVIQGDPLFLRTEKVKQPLCNSDIILMVRTLNLQADGAQEIYAKALHDFLGLLKPGAVIFCIDTKPSIAVITHQLCSFIGNYLYDPTYMNTAINIEHTDFYKEIFGCVPVISARGSFFVWQKSSSPSLNLEIPLHKVKESFRKNDSIHKDDDLLYDKLYKSTENLFGNSLNVQQNTIVSTIYENLNQKNGQFFGNKIDLNSKRPPDLKSVQDNISTCNNTKENEFCFLQNSTLVNQAVQTEFRDVKGDETTGMIKELNNKIAEITTKLSEMLQLNEYKNDSLLDKETECKKTVLNDSSPNCCCSIPSCMLSNQCKKCLQSTRNYCTACNCNQKRVFETCCQYHVCNQQEQYISNQYSSSNAHLENFRDDSYHNGLTFSTANNSVSTPKLVIPLNSLSGDTISQILSIITHSNNEQ